MFLTKRQVTENIYEAEGRPGEPSGLFQRIRLLQITRTSYIPQSLAAATAASIMLRVVELIHSNYYTQKQVVLAASTCPHLTPIHNGPRS
jgi:hypothetical protein